MVAFDEHRQNTLEPRFNNLETFLKGNRDMRFSFLTIALHCALISNVVLGDFIVPGFRGEPNSTYQAWDIFTSASGPNAPDAANNNPNGSAVLTQSTPGAFVTGGGNIYSPGGPGVYSVNVPDFNFGAEYSSSAVLQIRTIGSLLDTASITLNGFSPQSSQLLWDEPSAQGSTQEWAFTWNNLVGNSTTDLFAFSAQAEHMSLDRVSIDTFTSAVPEPNSLALLGLAGISITRRHRRR